MTTRRKRLLSRALAALAVLAALVASLAAYAEETLFDSTAFSNRAVSVLDDEAVQQQLASEITDGVIEAAPNAVAVRPLLESVAGQVVRSRALQSLLAGGVADVHATVINGNEDTLVVTLENVGVLIRQGLRAAAPSLPKGVSASLDVPVFNGGDGEGEGIVIDAAQFANDLKIGQWLALAVALAAALGSVALAPTRLAGIRRLGRALALGGVAAVIAWQIGRGLVVGQFDAEVTRDTARAIYNAFLIDLRTWFFVFAGFGIVITAGASSTREPVDIEAILRVAWTRLNVVPESTAGRIARAVALIVVGIAVIRNVETMVEILVVGVGALVIYAGAAELMRLAAGSVRRRSAETDAALEAEQDLSGGGLARVALVGVALLGVILIAGRASNEEELPPLAVTTCNGSVELCDRPLDEVAFAATHNSMSAATYDDWFFAQQEKGITSQLEDGIRALLIDPHYGVETSAGVATDLEKDFGSRAKIEAGLGSEAVAAAEALRRQIGYQGGGETEVFLCHGFCEIGSIRWIDGMREVRDFLLANPGEVVILSIEDATTPPDTIAGIESAGLGPYIYRGPNGPDWPTLGELIDGGERLVVMAERDGGDPPWYRRQFEITQETPFDFKEPEELERPSSCDENRGPPDAPFFLMNNWVDTSPAPRPTNAKVVNRKGFLLDRAAMCARRRGVEPNIVAVDFYRQGDVVGAVEELNGVGD